MGTLRSEPCSLIGDNAQMNFLIADDDKSAIRNLLSRIAIISFY
jgi:hypothetical protein